MVQSGYSSQHLSGILPELHKFSGRMPELQKTWGDEVYPLLSWFETRRVKEARVMVVGVGALGNEVLKNLALFGVGNLVIVDFDTIAYSNLTRSILFRPEDADRGFYKAEVAARRIKEINPEIHVQSICGDLATGVGLGVYRSMDVIIGCLDNLEARIQLNRLCFRAGKTWIDGSIGDLEGQVTVYQPGKNCYECNLTEDERRDVSQHTPCAGIVAINEKAGRTATTPVSASLIAAVQVQEAMKIIHPEAVEAGKFSTLTGKLFAYEGAHPSVSIFEFAPRDGECIAHEYWSPVVEIQTLNAGTTVSDALKMLRSYAGEMRLRSGENGNASKSKTGNVIPAVEINLRNNKFVDLIVSREGNKQFSPMLPESNMQDFILSSEELRHIQLSEGFYQHDFENIDDTFPYPHLTLRQIGIPSLDVIPISTPKGLFYVQLSM